MAGDTQAALACTLDQGVIYVTAQVAVDFDHVQLLLHVAVPCSPMRVVEEQAKAIAAVESPDRPFAFACCSIRGLLLAGSRSALGMGRGTHRKVAAPSEATASNGPGDLSRSAAIGQLALRA
jgi:hypothetical protein